MSRREDRRKQHARLNAATWMEAWIRGKPIERVELAIETPLGWKVVVVKRIIGV